VFAFDSLFVLWNLQKSELNRGRCAAWAVGAGRRELLRA
jgi:hypothetical protein